MSGATPSDKDFAYEPADLDAVRRQLSAPGWNRLVETRSRKTRADVDIYIMVDNNQAIGALIASEPRQFTIVNIIGAIDLEKLHKLEGQFGVPKLDIEPRNLPAPSTRNRSSGQRTRSMRFRRSRRRAIGGQRVLGGLQQHLAGAHGFVVRQSLVCSAFSSSCSR